ncbi:MAG: RNA polymerase sigma factor [Planctomycetota bacterium]|nr:RNA polymerase sigma factor [Planctomycetota bacterium]
MDRFEEQRVIERAAAGDKAACELLIKTHQASLFAYMLRMSGRPDIAEDIVQDAFVRILTNLQRFDPRFRFSTWLFTIAKRLYVNAMQKHRPVYDSDIVGSVRGGAHEPSAPAMAGEERQKTRECLDKALAGLNEEQRQIMLLFHQQEWSISQISEYMSMPEGTIKSHLHRGRKKMRRMYEAVEADASASVADAELES